MKLKPWHVAAVFLILLCIGFAVFAAVLTWSWTNATQNTDGSAIPASGDGRIVATNIEYGPCNAARDGLTSVTNTLVVSGTATNASSPNLPPGDWCARAAHVNSYGVAGVWSTVASTTIPAPTPKAPSNFTFGS